MGYVLVVETSSGAQPPTWFTCTDSRQLLFLMGEVRARVPGALLSRMAKVAGVDPSPLGRLVEAEEEPLDSFLARDPTEERRQIWHTWHMERETCWQPPAVLAALLHSIIAVLDGNPDIIPPTATSDVYFREGLLRTDLADLLAMVEWAEQNGDTGIRLTYG